MSDSYPTIQDALSDVQKEFMGCVEMHLDPPERCGSWYCAEALWRCDGGDGIKFILTVDEQDPDVSERSHAIEFFSSGDEPIARVSHSMKRVEASQGRYFWTESQFRVAGPEVPEGQRPVAEVEAEVRTYVEHIRELDCDGRLVEA